MSFPVWLSGKYHVIWALGMGYTLPLWTWWHAIPTTTWPYWLVQFLGLVTYFKCHKTSSALYFIKWKLRLYHTWLKDLPVVLHWSIFWRPLDHPWLGWVLLWLPCLVIPWPSTSVILCMIVHILFYVCALTLYLYEVQDLGNSR